MNVIAPCADRVAAFERTLTANLAGRFRTSWRCDCALRPVKLAMAAWGGKPGHCMAGRHMTRHRGHCPARRCLARTEMPRHRLSRRNMSRHRGTRRHPRPHRLRRHMPHCRCRSGRRGTRGRAAAAAVTFPALRVRAHREGERDGERRCRNASAKANHDELPSRMPRRR
jgi:hypothetical protein